MTDIRNVEVIAPNFKKRLSGVTSTIIQLIPVQNRLGQKVATLGPGLPAFLPRIQFSDLFRLWRRPEGRENRVWHARRNNEMLAGILLRDFLRMPLKIVFTSASQRRHTRWTKFLISRVDAVIATSAKTAAYLEVENTVIMHGVDTERFAPPQDKAAAKRAVGLDPTKHVVGCFGRVRHQKGTDLFVDAMIELLADRPDWIAIVAGRATASHVAYENDLKERVVKAGLSDRILFVGEHTNINEWYRALDLYVAPQRWEGFGLTPLEAMGSGVPVVAADVGVFSELIQVGHQETGIVAPAGSSESLGEAAAAFMDDDARRDAAGTRARARVTALFTLENEAASIGLIYRGLEGVSR